jgi:hypothetical protein
MIKLRQMWLVFRTLLAARTVQDFLWGPKRTSSQSWDTWINVLEKRIWKMREVDRTGRQWQVEARKRLLQVAAVAIAMVEWIDAGGK